MFAKFKLMLMLLAVLSPASQPNVYSAWTEDGIHLMISDNGTPDDFDDDFICDWEDNREFVVTILD